jgi:hypothetical protein
MLEKWTQQIAKCEVLDAKYDKCTLFWVLEVRSAKGNQWTVVFTHGDGFRWVEWRVLTKDGDGNWQRHAKGVVNLDYRQRRSYPQTVIDAVKFFRKTVLPHVLTIYPEF